jgi:hypothetical protein
VTQDSVVRDEMIVPEEKPTELQLMMRMFSMDRQQRIERDRERDQERLDRDLERLQRDLERAERDQRMDSIMEHLFESQSKLAERLVLVSEDIEKIHQAPRVTTNTSPNRNIDLDGDADADEQGGGKVFSSEPALKVSPIDQVSDQSRGEEHFFLYSANYSRSVLASIVVGMHLGKNQK